MDTGSYKVGALESTVKALQQDVTDIKLDQKSQNVKLDKLLELHHQRKGAVRFGKIIIGFVTSSGFAGWIWEHFNK